MKIHYYLIVVLLLTNFAQADDLDFCAKGTEVKTLATASSWANLRNNKGSLKYETTQILTSGLKSLTEHQKLLIKSTPNKLRKDSNDKQYCQNKFDQTSKSPLKYSPKLFDNVGELNEWIGDFSQGDGEEGSKMYSACDRDCSPRYQYSITTADGKLKLNAEVICGLPRDKDDNQYSLVAQCVSK